MSKKSSGKKHWPFLLILLVVASQGCYYAARFNSSGIAKYFSGDLERAIQE